MRTSRRCSSSCALSSIRHAGPVGRLDSHGRSRMIRNPSPVTKEPRGFAGFFDRVSFDPLKERLMPTGRRFTARPLLVLTLAGPLAAGALTHAVRVAAQQG